MRVLLQRVKQASVSVNGTVIGSIGAGLLLFLGVGANDEGSVIPALVEKILHLRIFPNSDGKLDLSLIDTKGEFLVVSQFTLYADCSKGRRPGFTNAAPPEKAEDLYNRFVAHCKEQGITTATGQFQAMMDVSLCNDGPFTLVLEA